MRAVKEGGTALGDGRGANGASQMRERSWKEVLMMEERTGNGAATVATEIVMPREGGPEVLRVGGRGRPIPAPNQAVVRVEAAGVSFAEVQMLKGRYFMQPKFPFVPGYDLVGRVVEVGGNVDGGLVGRRVAALTQTGSWADRVALDAAKLSVVPEGLDPAEAVAAGGHGGYP